MTNNAVKFLYEDLKCHFPDLKYILTYRLNQDVLENFFGIIRSKGGLHDHPDCLEFKYRLRSYILGKNQGPLGENANVENDKSSNESEIYNKDKLLSKECFSQLTKFDDDIPSDELFLPFEEEFDNENDIDDLKYDAIEHVTGYICHKIKMGSSSTTENFTWTDQLSEGGLIKPDKKLIEQVQKLEEIFDSVNKNSISIQKNFLKNLINLAHHIVCDDIVKKTFFRSRMYFRIKKLNHDLKTDKLCKKRKYSKILS